MLYTHSHPTSISDDVCIDVTPMVDSEGLLGVACDDLVGVTGGRLAQPRDERAQHLLRTLVCNKQKV